MRKFERGEAPSYLKKYGNKKTLWEEFAKTSHHKELSDLLYKIQHRVCAYCERLIKEDEQGKKEGHIEHLARRADSPRLTYDWNNLFFSCATDCSCGKYKDNRKNKIQFKVEDIIDPSKEEPQDFFTYNAQGTIIPRSDNLEDRRRALETIRVFNLNAPQLVLKRRGIITSIIDLLRSEPSEDVITAFLDSHQFDGFLTVYYNFFGKRL